MAFKCSQLQRSKLRLKCDCCGREGRPVIVTAVPDGDDEPHDLGAVVLLKEPPDWLCLSSTLHTRHLCPDCRQPVVICDSIRRLINTGRWL